MKIMAAEMIIFFLKKCRKKIRPKTQSHTLIIYGDFVRFFLLRFGNLVFYPYL